MHTEAAGEFSESFATSTSLTRSVHTSPCSRCAAPRQHRKREPHLRGFGRASATSTPGASRLCPTLQIGGPERGWRRAGVRAQGHQGLDGPGVSSGEEDAGTRRTHLCVCACKVKKRERAATQTQSKAKRVREGTDSRSACRQTGAQWARRPISRRAQQHQQQQNNEENKTGSCVEVRMCCFLKGGQRERQKILPRNDAAAAVEGTSAPPDNGLRKRKMTCEPVWRSMLVQRRPSLLQPSPARRRKRMEGARVVTHHASYSWLPSRQLRRQPACRRARTSAATTVFQRCLQRCWQHNIGRPRRQPVHTTARRVSRLAPRNFVAALPWHLVPARCTP